MKYKLKSQELQDVEKFLDTSPVAKLLRECSNWDFSIGDVLVKFKLDHDGNKTIEHVSEICPIPKKFRIVHIVNVGNTKIPWVKQVSVRGGLGNKLYCILNYSQPSVRWEVDPEQIDATLLGYKYDPRLEYKNMRTENPGYGGKKTD